MEETPMPFAPQAPKEPRAEHHPFAPRQQSSTSHQPQQTARPHGRSKRQWLLIGIGLVVLIALLLDGYNFWHQQRTKDSTSNVATPSTVSRPDTTPQPTGPNATDNASLDQDLKSINSSMTTANNSQAATDKALNDKSSQIDVPTE